MRRAATMSRRTVLAFAGMFALVALAGIAEPRLVLTMAPALLLLALLTGGVRPGEALIVRLHERRLTRPPRRARSNPRPRLALVVRPPGPLHPPAAPQRPPPSRPLERPPLIPP